MDVGLNGSGSGVIVLKKAGRTVQDCPFVWTGITRTRLSANARHVYSTVKSFWKVPHFEEKS